MRFAFEVLAGHLHFPLRHLQLPVLPLPAPIGVQFAQGQRAIFQDARPRQQAPVVQVQLHAAALLVHVQLQPGALHTGQVFGTVGQRLDLQAIGLDLGLVALGLLSGALPGQAQRRHLPRDVVLHQPLMPMRGQGQAQGHIAQGLQVQAVTHDLAFFWLLAVRVRQLHRHIAPGPGQPLLGDKGQIAGGQAPALRMRLPRQPAGQLGQAQRAQGRVQRGLHRAQVHVCGAADPFTLVDVRPKPQAALA